MMFELKRGLLLGFLVLFIAWSLFFTGVKMENLTSARDGEELSEAIIIKQSNSPPLPRARVLRVKTTMRQRIAQSPPPLRTGNPGPHQ
ncbi:hypothetical protein CMV_026554 [Castanea mollissima]|uniref:Uncharacterized protein n=1 Tax=Castanea mollissima TaxID=60419 RepID=A0A8J4QJT6_9ROSI|nr:hypothetical protein CMV_026554 [Castanea mollissima]